jgi:hypothetical protein
MGFKRVFGVACLAAGVLYRCSNGVVHNKIFLEEHRAQKGVMLNLPN